jgi:plastocyanin
MVRSGLAALLISSMAHATTVRGTVVLPPETRGSDGREAHWRVENGVLPIGPRVPDPRTEVVVALDGQGPKREAPAATATAELHGLRLDPRVIVIGVGGTVEFKNSDRVPHTLYVEHATSLMGPTPTPAGQSRAQKFFAAGEYPIRDEEYPHVEATVLAVQTPYTVRLDDKGGFKLDVPEGKYTLRVFYRGRWVLSQPLEVGSHSTDVTLQVPAGASDAAARAGATNEPAGNKP